MSPRYLYRAKRGPKEIVEGILEAESEEVVVQRLTEQGVSPIRVSPAPASRASFFGIRGMGRMGIGLVRPQEVTMFSRQMASLMRSHVPVLKSLQLLQERSSRRPLQRVLGKIADAVKDGQTLSEAFGRFPNLFSPVYRSLIHAGEVSGRMEEMLARIIEHRERQETLRSKVEMAMVYPIFLMLVGVGTVAVLLVAVIPRLTALFQVLEQALPWPTRAVIGTSNFLMKTWWLFAVLLLIVWVFTTREGPWKETVVDRVQMAVLFWRNVTQRVEVSRFFRTLGVLLDSGIPILQAVHAAVPTVENHRIRIQFAPIEGALSAGTPLSKCLEKVPAVSPLARGMVAVGEEGGDLPRQLLEISEMLEMETERSLKVMTTLFEPVLILILGTVIGIIVAAMLLPVFQIGSGMHME
ncbi:MAG: type II secretion system F family protein [Candidatus Omnitrophica bacterium]|nr:type II secretion system F family protein [Candidatus Omnitrophota bacterium]